MKVKTLKAFAIALAFFGATFFVGCANSSDAATSFINTLLTNNSQGSQGSQSSQGSQRLLNPASGMTQTQTAAASSDPITVAATTKYLVLSGAKGKTLYMARTNTSNTVLSSKNTRGIKTQASANIIETPDFLSEAEEDPHEFIYKNFWSGLKNYSLTAKSLASVSGSAVKNYSVGDTETFNALDPTDLQTLRQRTFKLLVSESDYNIWVDTNDAHYNAGINDFVTAAKKLGDKFINGYKLVSHIYGEPTKHIHLYNSVTGVFTKDEALSTYSKTGEKINILFYEMLEQGKLYGFVSPRDSIKGMNGSNEGRFLYLDSKTLVEEPMGAYSTSLHEFSHAISFNVKTLEQGVEWTYWYGEFLALLCEDMMQAYLGVSDSDVDGDLGNTPKGRLCTANYTDSWGYGLTGNASPTYAAGFLLGSWISRKFGGVKFIKELARNNSVDMKSILAAIQTAAGKTYTETSLLQEFAGDMLVPATNAGHNQNGATYQGNALYTCSYTDSAGQAQTYLYPITAINLWEPFYGWCDISNFSNVKGKNCISNVSIPFSGLPAKNTYRKHKYSEDNPPRETPTKAYLGPLLLNTTAICPNIGPYGSMLFNLGTVDTDSLTIQIACAGGESFGDELTFWVKD